jgi:hypothetical protein
VCLPAVASSSTLKTVGNMNIKMHILNAQDLCNELLELSVGIVRSWTQTMEFSLVFIVKNIHGNLVNSPTEYVFPLMLPLFGHRELRHYKEIIIETHIKRRKENMNSYYHEIVFHSKQGCTHNTLSV